MEQILSKIDSLGLLLRHERALDFGCGVGRLTRPLGARFAEVVGIDISSKMVELARGFSPPPNCKFVVNNKSDLSVFPDGHFDLIISIITLQHINPRIVKNYLREFMRVLSSGGIAYFQVPERWKDDIGLIDRLYYRAATWLWNHRHASSVYVLLRRRPIIEMHGIQRADVVSFVESAGGLVKSVESWDPNLGAGCCYLVSKA